MNNQQKHNETDGYIAVDEMLWRGGLALTSAELRKILNATNAATVVPVLALYGQTVQLTEKHYAVL